MVPSASMEHAAFIIKGQDVHEEYQTGFGGMDIYKDKV
jgi:hypothetical protein